MRIVSMLPGATEVVYLLGLGAQLHGVSHECDYPADARTRRVVTRSPFDPHSLPSAEIDRLVRETHSEGRELYHVDARALSEIRPDLILTQGLCEVCAVSVRSVKAATSDGPTVLSLDATSLEEVLLDIQRVANAAGVEERGRQVVSALCERLEAVRGEVSGLRRKRVACLEWLDPLFNAGHWAPEMVALAGGEEVLGRAAEPSRQVEWEEVRRAAPEVLLLIPCGFGPQRSLQELPLLERLPGWEELPAVQHGQVWAADSSSYFSRPGPRLVDGAELTARMLHPRELGEPSPQAAVRALTGSSLGRSNDAIEEVLDAKVDQSPA